MEVVVFFFNSFKTDICKPRVYYDDFTVSVNIVAKRRNTFLCVWLLQEYEDKHFSSNNLSPAPSPFFF